MTKTCEYLIQLGSQQSPVLESTIPNTQAAQDSSNNPYRILPKRTMADTSEVIWDKPKDVPEWVIESVDANVLAGTLPSMAVQVFAYDFPPELPPGTRVEGIYPHGKSYWTRTAAIRTLQADGRGQSFFLKVSCRKTT